MTSLSIIVPTYNESGNIGTLLERLFDVCKRNFEKHEIIVVDDNSPDDTASAVRRFSKNRNLRLFVRHRRGLASAVKFGIGKSKYETICVMDADMLHDPETIPRMMRKLYDKNADIVTVGRFSKGSKLLDIPTYRKIISKYCNKTMRIIFPKLSINDPLTGFFMFRKRVLKGVKLKAYGFKILLEILVKAKYNTVIEIPSTFRGRLDGESKLTFMEYLKFIQLILHLLAFRFS